ncbi:MAG TPA: hypothetical protein VKR27_08110, partial [Acidimicrobiales bacterium]|nr:hypothetical protein [Acidimicrobiales bacterium]
GKSPHWTGKNNSTATFGHFGQLGSFIWVDPAVSVALVVLSDRAFGPWAAAAWPVVSDAVLAERRVKGSGNRPPVLWGPVSRRRGVGR